ncbi:MAG: EAL domain-containing protein [Sulfuricurvum sp.]|nr:EAL domain-containing protein [Sulfuricurvum sp.]
MAFPKNQSSLFINHLWQMSVVFLLFILSFSIYVYSEKQLDRANEMRLNSFLLASELRQSSDDLTRMIRTYAATENIIYKQHYQEILDIRNGVKPRPLNYQNIYWDLVGLDGKRPRNFSNQTIPLIEMMRQAGFSQEEFAKLSEAKNNSDALTKTEFTAMKLIEGKGTDVEKAKQKAKALEILHDEAYHKAKASIMRPIDEFYILMEKRTERAVHKAALIATALRIIFVMIGIVLFFMLLRLYRSMQIILGGSIDEVHNQISRIGKGDFSETIHIPVGAENSILGWLSETQQRLKELINHNERLKLLYSALSQCNQAIVRSKNEEELFPIICRDAVNFGGMKMAWIGMSDEITKQIKVVSSYGNGIEYLENIQISIEDTNPTSHGPTGNAFHTDKSYWCQDFLHSDATKLWHERGKAFGWGSSASVPLHCNGKVVGVFTLYAEEANAFDDIAQKLIEEMAMDISYALDGFQSEIERKRVENALRESQERLESIILNEPECVKLIGLDGKLIDMNPAGLAMMEADTLQDAQNYNLSNFLLPEWRTPFIEMHQCVINGGNAKLEFEILGLKGTHRWLETNAVPMHDANGNVSMLLGITRDVTERKENEKRIHYLANFDGLTGLPNRSQLDTRIKDLLSLSKRHHRDMSVMFLDLDHFKDINDSLGHSIGDHLLVKVAKSLESVLREEDTIARLGGDEFIILLPNISMNGAAKVAQKMLDTLKKSFHIQGHELSISGSIGIAFFPNDGNDFETLYKNADTAMYRAKQDGRNAFCFFTEEMQKNSVRHLELGNALRHALDRDQFELHFQPQFSAKDKSIIGAEALLRWHHPEFGTVSPYEFIPIAEENGTILAIGEWVLKTATLAAKKWMDQGMAPIIVAVNLSAVQFRSLDLPNLISDILKQVGLPPEYLELELTESIAMHDPHSAINIMNDLHKRGIRMSIDDFGTGYSSLSYLKKFNIYKLKIDQSFVRDINVDPEDKAIVSAIISMAKSLGLQTIAEGVETIGQLDYLKQQGCDEIQGYYFSKPLPIEEFETFRKEF